MQVYEQKMSFLSGSSYFPSTGANIFSYEYVTRDSGGEVTLRTRRDFLLKQYKVTEGKKFDFAFILGNGHGKSTYEGARTNWFGRVEDADDSIELSAVLSSPEIRGRVVFNREGLF